MSPKRPTIKAVRTPATRQASRCTNRAVREKWLKFVQRHRVDFQRADFKACLIVFRPFRERLLRKQLGIYSGGYSEHEAE